MIRPITDPDIINHFANHPDIAINCDFSGAIRETARFYFGEHGGLIFEWCAPGTWEVHIMLTKAGRGRWGLEAVQDALTQLGAERVWARIQEPKVAIFARWSGFREVEQRTLYADGEPSIWRIFEWRK